MSRHPLPTCTLALTLLLAAAPAGAADLAGRWLTEGANAMVEIGACEAGSPDRVCGTIVWLWQPNDERGQPRRDAAHPSTDRRDRPLVGTEILSGFAPKSPGQWTGGRIYNPEDGRTYDASLRLDGTDTLVVEGCVLFICKKQVWRRSSAICPAG